MVITASIEPTLAQCFVYWDVEMLIRVPTWGLTLILLFTTSVIFNLLISGNQITVIGNEMCG